MRRRKSADKTRSAMIHRLPERLKLAALLTGPVVILEMSRHLTGRPSLGPTNLAIWSWIMAVATSVVVLYCGWPLIQKGWLSFRRRRLNMFSMIAPGVLITYGYSMLAFLAPDLFPDSFRHHGQVPVYFEAAAMIVTLVLLGQLLESRAEQKTGSALEALGRLQPTRASVMRGGVEQWVSTDDIHVDDIISLRAGDRIPCDGAVTSGSALIDESMMTGEPFGVTKSPGDQLVGGTLAREGSLLMRAEKIGEHTALARIIQMVKSAQESRAPIQRVADRVTGKLVPVVMMIATITMIVWWWLGPEPAAWYGLLHAVTVLMITCPCALGLATPLSITTGLGRGALAGILIKDAAHLEQLASVDTMIFDKTGTLTTGKPTLHACIPMEPGNEGSLLKQAASVEVWSHHPLAQAIVDGARAWGVALEDVHHFQSSAGSGVSGQIAGNEVSIGRRTWLELDDSNGFDSFDAMARQFEEEGRTVVWVAINRQPAGMLVISDELKPHTEWAIRALQTRDIRCMMLTGDTARAAGNIGRRVGIDEIIAGVLPDQKATHVMALKESGRITAMVGDGINDAPALASADVGIALGTGTAVAIASGQINLLYGDVVGLVQAVDLSRAVMRNIRQNLFFAFAYNAIMIPVAAGVLFPSTGWMLTPMLASAAMSASSVTVMLNALRLRKLDLSLDLSALPR
jgi:Cu+-exporting ATPase